jgi:TRAP-type C4-dicarboxylate transport system permease large subunit
MFLSGISASAVADASALGSVLIPGMVRQGYGKGFAAALVVTAATIILSPTLLAVAQAVGIHPLHFGLVMVLNLSIGLITPPVGVLLFVVCGITGYPFALVTRWTMPFLAAHAVTLVAASYFPVVVMWVPELFGYV